MKRRIFIALFIAILFMLYASASADTLTLPAELKAIGEEAFCGNTHLDSVVLGENVLEIGARAFADSSLKSINLPASLETIAADALPAPGTLTVTAPEGSRAYDWAVEHGYIEDSWVSSPLEDFVINNGVVTKYVGPGGDVVIPSKDEDGNPVTAISLPDTDWEEGAFYECNTVTSVIIPSSVTIIGNFAFSECSGLTYVTIPNSVTSIGEYAFESCSSLTSVTIPEGVASIGEGAFESCSGLTNVTIPNSVTIIRDWVFGECSSLMSVTISNSVTDIGEYAFSACRSLTSVTIGSGVKSIGERAFGGCSNLTSIDVESKNNHFSSIDGVLFNKEQTIIITYPGDKQGEYVIPSSVTSIGACAFECCSSLTGVTIPNSVIDIGDWAFCGCSSLTNVTIGNSVTNIMGCAFSDCSSLTSVTIPNSVTLIRDWVFSDCSSLTSVTIPASVTEINDCAFRGCDRLTTVEAEEGTYAYVWAVQHGYIRPETDFEVYLVPNKGDVTEENGVRVCQHLPGAFYMGWRMAEFAVVASDDYTVEYNAGHEDIGDEEDYIELEGFIDLYAFEEGSYYDYTHVNNGDILSREATGLYCDIYDNRSDAVRETTIKFTCGDKTITYIFSQQPILSSRLIAPLDILQYQESAGESALPAYGKSDLTLEWASVPGVARYELCHLIIDAEHNGWQDRYERIGSPILPTTEDSFTTTIPASFWDEVGEQGEVYLVMLTYDAWGNEYRNHPYCSTQPEYCFRMIQNTDAPDFDYAPVRDEGTGEITGACISGYRGTETDVVIPATINGLSVVAVRRNAFKNNKDITSVVIPTGVTSIGDFAFYSCASLTYVMIPGTVTEIERNAFMGCTSLADITLPPSVISIGIWAFDGCPALTIHGVPGSVAETYAKEYHIPFVSQGDG